MMKFFVLILLMTVFCAINESYVLHDDIKKYANATLVRSCVISLSVDGAKPSYVTIPANVTPWDYIVNNICLHEVPGFNLNNCIQRGLTLVISSALGESIGIIDIKNGFGETVSKDIISKVDGIGFNTIALRSMTLLTNEGLFFDEQDKDFYSRGYCAPKYHCPLSIPQLALIEVPRCGSSILKKWIIANEHLYFKKNLETFLYSKLELESESSALLSDTVYKGHYPFTKMICCKYASMRVKLISTRNPFDRAISLFEHFLLGNNIKDISGRGFLPLDRKRSNFLTIVDENGGYDGLVEISDLNDYIKLSTQYDDFVCESHAVSQLTMLLEAFIELRTPVLATESTPLSIEALREWLRDLYIVHSESLFSDMNVLFQSMCEIYGIRSMCRDHIATNDDSDNRNSSDNNDDNDLNQGNNMEFFNTLNMVRYNYTPKIYTLSDDAIQRLLTRYECDFIAFGYSVSYYTRENHVSSRIQRLDEVMECLGRHNLLSHYSII